jgi:hypothetical protein
MEEDFHSTADARLTGEGAKRSAGFQPWYPAAPDTSQSPKGIGERCEE